MAKRRTPEEFKILLQKAKEWLQANPNKTAKEAQAEFGIHRVQWYRYGGKAALKKVKHKHPEPIEIEVKEAPVDAIVPVAFLPISHLAKQLRGQKWQ